MARKLRLEYAGACYHVINRGNYRRNLFAGPGAAESFQTCLLEAVGRFGWRLHAFVSVTQYVRRFRLRGGTGTRAFAVALSKVHT